MEQKVILPIQNNKNKFQVQSMIATKKILSVIRASSNILRHYMDFTTNSINKRKLAIRVKNSTFMDERAKAQEHICQPSLSICHWQRKHLNSLFPRTIEAYWLRNSGMCQVQEITKTKLKALKFGIKFRHSQCQGPPGMLVSLNMVHNILPLSRRAYSEYFQHPIKPIYLD